VALRARRADQLFGRQSAESRSRRSARWPARWRFNESNQTFCERSFLSAHRYRGVFFSVPNSGGGRASALEGRCLSLRVWSRAGVLRRLLGPGTGSFWAMAYVLLLDSISRRPLRTRTDETSPVTWLTGGVPHGGKVQLIAGLVMGAGQLLGAWLGAKMVIARGARFIRPIFMRGRVCDWCAAARGGNLPVRQTWLDVGSFVWHHGKPCGRETEDG